MPSVGQLILTRGRRGRQFDRICDAELGEDMREVRLDRRPAHEQLLTDLGIGQADGDQLDDFPLRRCETAPSPLRPGPCPSTSLHQIHDVVQGQIFPRAPCLIE